MGDYKGQDRVKQHSAGRSEKGHRVGSPIKPLSAGKRIFCPVCGNDRYFYEVAENVVLTTKYVQNRDGSFTALFDDSTMKGSVRLFCAECDADLTKFHSRFVEMLF
jgi:hypothetical protein